MQRSSGMDRSTCSVTVAILPRLLVLLLAVSDGAVYLW